MKRGPLLTSLLSFFLGCASPPTPSVTAPPPARSAESAKTSSSTTLSGDIVAPPDATAKGRLVLGFRTAAEQREIEAGRWSLKIARAMMDRWTVGEEVDLSKTRRFPYKIEGAPGDATPVAVLDVEHTFWRTIFSGGKGLQGNGPPGGGVIPIVPNPPKKVDGEPCSGPRRKLVLVTSTSKIGQRRFCAWLPESFDRSARRRYPMIFLLPGLLSTEMAYLGGERHLGVRTEGMMKVIDREAILVGVDTSIDVGSTYFEDSPLTGPFDTFIKEALPVLERELRGLGGRTARALVGQSTGGHNALSLGLRHSDLFSIVAASAPDAPDVEAWMLEPGTRRARTWIAHWMKIEDALGGAGQHVSYAANWSPDPASPRGFRWPIDPTTGDVDEKTFGQWVARSPKGLLRDPALRARAKKDLSGRLMIIVGRHDEFELFAPAESFATELNALGIETRFVPTNDGHGDQEGRLDRGVQFALERLDRPRD